MVEKCAVAGDGGGELEAEGYIPAKDFGSGKRGWELLVPDALELL